MISRTIGWFGFGISPTPFHHHIEHTLTVGAIHLHAAVQNICSMHSSSWYAKCYMPYVIDSPRSIEMETELPRFRVPPAQYWIIRPDYKMEHSPHGLFALPAALLAWERTCHFKHCSYAIFTNNTDEIRGGSIVENIAVICHYHFRRTFRYDFVNTDWYMC